MSNFEYIISSLPFLTTDYRYADGQGFGTIVEEIRSNLSEKDEALMDFLLRGLDGKELDADFYALALSSKDRFIREYFRFDLNLRNAKTVYINKALGRPAGTDVMTGEGEDGERVDIDGYRFTGGEFEEELQVENALAEKDLLEREKALDDLIWKKAEDLTTFHYFDIDAVLGYLAKLKIADRWIVLDEEKGRELFQQLVKEVKGTFKGVRYTEE